MTVSYSKDNFNLLVANGHVIGTIGTLTFAINRDLGIEVVKRTAHTAPDEDLT